MAVFRVSEVLGTSGPSPCQGGVKEGASIHTKCAPKHYFPVERKSAKSCLKSRKKCLTESKLFSLVSSSIVNWGML